MSHNVGTRERLEAGVGVLGVALPSAAVEQLLAFLLELQKWNAAYNLTAIRDPQEMVTRHLLDSLALLPLIDALASDGSRVPGPGSRLDVVPSLQPRPLRLLDAGAGAGLPAIPLAIARPDWRVTALDSNGKKARFMRHAVRTLKLPNVEVAEARAESFEAPDDFDVVVSRAFASLAEFFDKTAQLLAPGGQWVAMKGKLDARELAEVPTRFQIKATQRLHVPGLDEERHAVIAVPEPRAPESQVPIPESRLS